MPNAGKSDEMQHTNTTLVRVNELTLAIPKNVIYSYFPNTFTHTQSIVLLVPHDSLKFEPYKAAGPRSGNLFVITLRPESEANVRFSGYESQIAGQKPEVRDGWDIYSVGGGSLDLYVNKTGGQPRFFTCPPDAKIPTSLAICNVRQIFRGDTLMNSGNGGKTTVMYQFTPPDIPRLAKLNERVLYFVNSLLVSR